MSCINRLREKGKYRPIDNSQHIKLKLLWGFHMAKNKAIVTLVYGKKYQDYFKKFCEKNWKEYANKHGYDIVLFDQLLDKTERALNRSPSWQKCLALSHEDLDKYKQQK